MTSKANSQNLESVYTDSPNLHPNLFLASLQLLGWFFFHPSAWRNYAARIEPELSADFSLIQLKKAHFYDPALRRLFVIAYLIYPIFIGLIMGPILWLLNNLEIPMQGSEVEYAEQIFYAFTFCLVTSLSVSLTAGVRPGIVYGITLGFTIGIADGMAYGIPLGLAYGLTAGLASNTALTTNQNSTSPLLKRLIGLSIGISTVILLFIAVYIVVSGWLIGSTPQLGSGTNLEDSLLFGLAGGILFTLTFGQMVWWRTGKWVLVLGYGLAIGLVGGIAYDSILVLEKDSFVHAAIMLPIGGGLYYGGFWAITYLSTDRIAGPVLGAISAAFVAGTAWVLITPFLIDSDRNIPIPLTLFLTLIVILLGLTFSWWRPRLLYGPSLLYNFLLYNIDEKRSKSNRSLLRWNSAFWEEHQSLSLKGLEDHLVLTMERNPIEGKMAIEYLAVGHQRWAAQEAIIEIEARRLETCMKVKDISKAHYEIVAGDLMGPANIHLQTFQDYSRDIEIALNNSTISYQRLTLEKVKDKLARLKQNLIYSDDPYAKRFFPIAKNWYEVIINYESELAQIIKLRQEINSPYIPGSPLSLGDESFIKRTDILSRIEKFLLKRGSPPLFLYGQRRMGKTSLLQNLAGLLQNDDIVCLFVDGQRASSASNYSDFLYSLISQIVYYAKEQYELTLPSLSRRDLNDNPSTTFFEWLDKIEDVFITQGRKIIVLVLDEFEGLDDSIEEGRFDATDAFRLLRHIIQHRPRIKILLAGSHTIDEFERWSSYLVNVQVIKVSYLTEENARLLIENPIENFPLGYEPDASRKVLELTRGHPCLTQLLCDEIISQKNEQDTTARWLVQLVDVEMAIPKVLHSGVFLFVDIERNQVNEDGKSLLRFLAERGEGAVVDRETLAQVLKDPNALSSAIDLLIRRDLIEAVNDGYRFQVELIRHWFANSRQVLR